VPLYEYECKKCGHRFEEIQQFSDPPIKKCPKCKKGKVVKLPSAPAVQFKGTGWYVTDYARKGTAPAPSERGGEGSKEKTEKEGGKKPAAGDTAGGKAASVKKGGKSD
jgi:putative FmdB family regulatory protein